MALDLKRKRAADSGARKSRKVVPTDVEVISVSHGADAEDETSGEEGSDAEGNASNNDEEWNGVAARPFGRTEGSKAFRPPTGQELEEIKEASDLFQSSSFKLQIDALLPNVRPKEAKVLAVEHFILGLHKILLNIKPVAPQHPLQASRKLLKKGISVAYSQPLPTEDTKWTVEFQPPTDITLVGSWANKIAVKGQDNSPYGLDIAVEMPSSLFQEKDYLNARFFHKRAFYLASIAAALSDPKVTKGALKDLEISYTSMNDDPRLTKLVLSPIEKDGPSGLGKANAQICIIPYLSSHDAPIALKRLNPSFSSVRMSLDEMSDNAPLQPTPLYNNTLLLCTTPKEHLLSTHAVKNAAPAFTDALALLRIWANQRGFGFGSKFCVKGFDTGHGIFWESVLEVVINGEDGSWRSLKQKMASRKPLGRGLSSYQLFRAALDFLANHDWENVPVFLKSRQQVNERALPMETYGTNCVLVDSSRYGVNLIAGTPLGSLKLLSHDAKTTLETLRTNTSVSRSAHDPFQECFLKDQRELATRFDAILRVDLSTAKPLSISAHAVIDSGSAGNTIISSLAALLERGLGDRVHAISIMHPSSTSRPLAQALPATNPIIDIGLILNEKHAFRQVDHGPPASDASEKNEEAEAFRELWGDKAELRRFKDGRIMESVVWDVKTAEEKSHIPLMIVRHLLTRHFSISETESTNTWHGSFDGLLRLSENVSRIFTSSPSGAVGFKAAMAAFDGLVKQIRNLGDNLPLSLMNISASSEALRYTTPFVPLPLTKGVAAALPANARYLQPINIVIQFEKSGKWPDDLKAIQKIKLAFFHRIAEGLMEANKGMEVRVVLGSDTPTSDIEDQAFLEIITAQGWAFHGRIWHDREATLLDRILQNKLDGRPHVTKKDNKEWRNSTDYKAAAHAKEVYLRRFVHGPLHHRAIAKLTHNFGAFAGTVRLVKRWLASHWLLESHISPEVIEIICAQFFVSTPDWERKLAQEEENVWIPGVPSSKERGFAMVVEFLKSWKWDEGLFVPLYGETDLSSIAPAGKTPAVSTSAWRIRTEADQDGTVWALNGPVAPVARKIKVIAAATWDALLALEESRLPAKSLFVHPTDNYDFIIRLDPKVIPRYAQNVNALDTNQRKFANHLDTADISSPVMPGFDPARILFEHLQRIYADTFKLFHDPLGGDQFGGYWDPTLKAARPFKALAGYSSMPCPKDDPRTAESPAKSKDLVVLNEQSILAEIERMGSGIITSIATRT